MGVLLGTIELSTQGPDALDGIWNEASDATKLKTKGKRIGKVNPVTLPISLRTNAAKAVERGS